MQTQQQPPSTEQIREFVIAGHGNLDKVKQMLAENPQLLNASYQWNDNDRETAIQAAAQVGNAQVARYLIDKGAPLEICTAATLGQRDEVERRLKDDPGNAVAKSNYEIARWLLENAEPDIGSKSFQGKTPLMVATERKDEKIAQLLVAHGAKG